MRQLRRKLALMATKPLHIIEGKTHDLGGGMRVKRLIPTIEKRSVGPFVFLDHIGPARLPADANTPRPGAGGAPATPAHTAEATPQTASSRRSSPAPAAIPHRPAAKPAGHGPQRGRSPRRPTQGPEPRPAACRSSAPTRKARPGDDHGRHAETDAPPQQTTAGTAATGPTTTTAPSTTTTAGCTTATPPTTKAAGTTTADLPHVRP